MGQDRGLQESLLGKFLANTSATAPRTDISVFGQGVSIHYQHREVRELFRPAIRHLEMTGLTGSPDLEIFCFVSDKPPLRWLREKGLSTRINQTIHLSTFRYCYQGHSLFAFDAEAKRAFYWVDGQAAFNWYRARPFTRILSWFAEHRQLTWVHAACVGTESGAILIPAAGGSGKSTAAAAGLLSGMLFIGDDFNLLDKERLEVASLYGNVVLSARSIGLLQGFERVNQLAPAFRDKKSKDCYQLFDHFHRQLKPQLHLKGILVPEIVTGNSEIVPACDDDAMRAFVSSLQIGRILGIDPKPMLADVYAVVKQVHVARLRIGRDLESVPHLISDFLT
jgi:hypothetical protein